jgi:hypothetical protein
LAGENPLHGVLQEESSPRQQISVPASLRARRTNLQSTARGRDFSPTASSATVEVVEERGHDPHPQLAGIKGNFCQELKLQHIQSIKICLFPPMGTPRAEVFFYASLAEKEVRHSATSPGFSNEVTRLEWRFSGRTETMMKNDIDTAKSGVGKSRAEKFPCR